MDLLRSAWIEVCAEQLAQLRPALPPDECKTLATRMWGSAAEYSPVTAAALLDRMLARRDGDEPLPGAPGRGQRG
jgi:hypothetical protein